VATDGYMGDCGGLASTARRLKDDVHVCAINVDAGVEPLVAFIPAKESKQLRH
jgi:hypothetical protein